MRALFDLLGMFFALPFATLWDTWMTERAYCSANPDDEDRSERIYFACASGIASIMSVCALAVWKLLLLFGLHWYPLPWEFALVVLGVSIVTYAMSFGILINEEESDNSYE